MTIVVTGATGHLGRLAVQALLRRGVPAEQIPATGRRTETLTDLAEQGVTVRRADYTDPASLREAFPAPSGCCWSPATGSPLPGGRRCGSPLRVTSRPSASTSSTR